MFKLKTKKCVEKCKSLTGMNFVQLDNYKPKKGSSSAASDDFAFDWFNFISKFKII